MNMLPLSLYVVAGVAYAFYFARRSPRTGRLATASLAGAALIHTPGEQEKTTGYSTGWV